MLLVVFLLCFVTTATANEFFSPGPLAQPHKDIEGLANCVKCHAVGSDKVSADLCMDCHVTIREQVDTQKGYHALRGANCESCHADHRGTDHPLVQLDKQSFHHASTGFPLNVAHDNLQCNQCHETPGKWVGLIQTCTSCHGDEQPHGAEHSTRDLLKNCESCHVDTKPDWSALPLATTVFNHTDSEQVDYILEHAHTEVACVNCHENWSFVPVVHSDCNDCHQQTHHTDFKNSCEDTLILLLFKYAPRPSEAQNSSSL